MRIGTGSVRSIFLMAALAACAPAEKEAGDAPRLPGEWTLQVTSSSWPPDTVRGVVSLVESRDTMKCPPDLEPCRDSVRGSHTVPFRELLGQDLDPVDGAVTQAGELLLNFGPCCDRGEVFARGSWNGRAFVGRWTEATFADDGRSGRFVLTPRD